MAELITDKKTITEARGLRDAALRNVLKIGTKGDSYSRFAKLLELPNPCGSIMEEPWINKIGQHLIAGISQEQLNILRALNGPHGYAVYKMLLAKKNNLQE